MSRTLRGNQADDHPYPNSTQQTQTTREVYTISPTQPNHIQTETKKLLVSATVYESLRNHARRIRKSTPPSILLEQLFKTKDGILIAGLVPDTTTTDKPRTLHVSKWLFERLQYVQKKLNQEDWNFSLSDIVSAHWRIFHASNEPGEFIAFMENDCVGPWEPGKDVGWLILSSNEFAWGIIG